MLKIVVENDKKGGTSFHSETKDTNTFEAFNAIIGLFEMILKLKVLFMKSSTMNLTI